MTSPIGIIGRIRLLLRLSAIAATLLVCLILYALAQVVTKRNPVPRHFLRAVLRIAGGRLHVRGHRPQAPAILLANHLSWIDILALAGATGSAFVGHAGLAQHRALRFLCRLHGTVFITRERRASVGGQVGQVRDGLHESGVLTLFPEGTTGDDVELKPFKSSLLAAVEDVADVGIHPTWIDYGDNLEELAWIGDEPGLSNVSRVLARPGRFPVTVHVLPALAAGERQDRKAMAAAAHQAIADAIAQRTR